MYFKKLEINEWQQFEKINIEFHNRLTILTWANGSWKTTILSSILARHCNWNTVSIKTPEKNIQTKLFEWFGKWKNVWTNNREVWVEGMRIGSLEYSNKLKCNINEPQWSNAGYQIAMNWLQQINSFYIPSHRTVFKYQQVTQIPTVAIEKKEAFDKVSNANRSRYLWDWYWSSSSNFIIKETLISWNIFWKWNDSMEADERLLGYYEWFEEVLKNILPKTLWFQSFSIRSFEITLVCNSGDFILDWASWWISAIIDLAWQLYMYSDDKKLEFTAIIDEIENHLHPKMQREILPNLLQAFPSVKFIISTHSPLIINSVKESSIYVLKYNDKNRVESKLLDLKNEAKTSSDILDEVLWVGVTIPIWAENKLEDIIDKYSQKDLNNKSEFSNLRLELEENWLWTFIPKAILELIEHKND